MVHAELWEYSLERSLFHDKMQSLPSQLVLQDSPMPVLWFRYRFRCCGLGLRTTETDRLHVRVPLQVSRHIFFVARRTPLVKVYAQAVWCAGE